MAAKTELALASEFQDLPRAKRTMAEVARKLDEMKGIGPAATNVDEMQFLISGWNVLTDRRLQNLAISLKLDPMAWQPSEDPVVHSQSAGVSVSPR